MKEDPNAGEGTLSSQTAPPEQDTGSIPCARLAVHVQSACSSAPRHTANKVSYIIQVHFVNCVCVRSCGKPGKLQCPKCLELQLPKPASVFCSQECFKVNSFAQLYSVWHIHSFTVAQCVKFA